MLRSPGLLETARRTWGVRHIFAATLAGRFLRTINFSDLAFFSTLFFQTLQSRIIVQVLIVIRFQSMLCTTITLLSVAVGSQVSKMVKLNDGTMMPSVNLGTCCGSGTFPPPSLFQLRWNPRTILQHAEQHVPSHRRVAAQHNCIQACY